MQTVEERRRFSNLMTKCGFTSGRIGSLSKGDLSCCQEEMDLTLSLKG
ncbi:hypothetical protein LINPERHAP1_LOCUS30232 [Linum perenne]